MKEKKETPHIGKTMVPPRWKPIDWASANLPVLIVLSFCLVFAVQLGAMQPELHFQKVMVEKSLGTIFSLEDLGSDYAYASGDSILFKLQHAPETGARALFLGTGHTSSIAYAGTDQTVNVTRIMVDEKVACSPCIPGKEYPVDADGNVSIVVFAKEAALAPPPDDRVVKHAFFEKRVITNINALVNIKLIGGWRSNPNAEVPSSFYGEDAPFHINRVSIGASHLLRMQWPWAEYTFLSTMPAGLIFIIVGNSHQYAYKLWEIILFFLPVAAFYLFSRKLSRGKDAVFLFASLIYLFLPSQGVLNGGGADLFMYGMTAHTFATLLSLISLLFAYEFVVERKNLGFWLSLLFFLLAVASNPRILMALAVGMGTLLVLSYFVADARRALILGIACVAGVAFLVAPIVLNVSVGQMGPNIVGGVSFESTIWSIIGVFQLGFYILPLLFIIGAAAAISKREMFVLFLFVNCVFVFVIATSQEINKIVPFLDGLRFLPSFFLPMFFISGIGALSAFEFLVAMVEKSRWRLKLDRLDAAMSVCLVIIIPFALFFAGIALTAMDQYRDMAAPAVAAEYSELQAAYGMTGEECVFIQGRMDVSQYPIYERGLDRSFITIIDSSGGIIDAMANMRCRYLILGNVKTGASITENTRWQEYIGFKNETRLKEIAYGGSNRLFVLKGVKPAAKVESDDARVGTYSFDYDRGAMRGECMAETCTIRIRQDRLPGTLACVGADGCNISYGTDNAVYVSKIPRGKFDIALEPKTANWFYPLVFVGALVALACGHAAGKLPENRMVGTGEKP